jgi:hypothetical protein
MGVDSRDEMLKGISQYGDLVLNFTSVLTMST